MEWTRHVDSPLGGITLASDGEALTGLWFDGQKHFADTLTDDGGEKALAVFDETERWLALYFSGVEPDFTPPLRLRGTPFRQRVWEQLRAIPYGETVSYAQLAQRLAEGGGGKPSARAVGGAVGHNPISLIVPCHRVVGADGSLRGYAGGLKRKEKLLALERAGRAAAE